MVRSKRKRRFIGAMFGFMSGLLLYPILSGNTRKYTKDRLTTKWLSGSNVDYIKSAEHLLNVRPTPPSWQKFLCSQRNVSMDVLPKHAIPLEMISDEHTLQPSQDNIFLMETACNPLPLYRTWCSVESWALQNPMGRIWYLMTSPYVDNSSGVVQTLLKTYSHLRIAALDFQQIFDKTPLKDLLKSLKWAEGTDWPAVQLSDMARLVLVWTYGGYYSDTDVISIASTSGLYDVIGIFEGGMEFPNGQFHCSPKHSFLLEVMRELANNFDLTTWGGLGPAIIKRVMEKHCGPRRTTPKSKVFLSCINMTLLPPLFFTPVHYETIDNILVHGSGRDFEKVFKNTYSIHFFGHLTSKQPIKAGSETVFDVAAKRYCPITYKYMTFHSKFY